MKYFAECPGCNGQFEIGGITAAESGLQCAFCGHKFTPEKIHKVTPGVADAVDRLVKHNQSMQEDSIEKLSEIASYIQFLCLGVIILAIIFLGYSCFSRLADGTWNESWILSAGAFSFAVLLFFVSQMLHIRAALERLNNK